MSVLNPSVVVELDDKPKLRLEDARLILGVDDSALSMRSFDEYARLTEQLLSSTRKAYLLSLGQDVRALVDVTIKIRHTIAHRSDRAADALNAALQNADLRTELRSGAQAGGRITSARVGRYLVAKRAGRMRTCWLLDDIAAMTYAVARTTGRHRVICDCMAS